MQRPLKRIRFVECEVARQGERWRGRVVLAGGKDATTTGTAERELGPDADLWCVAEATVTALRQALDLKDDALKLKEVLQFDVEGGAAVAVALRGHDGQQRRRLFGLAAVEDDRARAAALSVLNATNRFFSGG
jgi:hypothetical protein